jgi:hypothetical protein
VGFLVFSLAQVAVAQTIVWTDVNARKIQRKEVSGGAVATIIQFQSPQGASRIHYDPITAKLYYLRSGPSVFQRANLDGSAPENIPTPSVGAFALNIELRKLYWNNSDNIYRSELNGSEVESHTYPNCCLYPLLALGDDLFLGAWLDMEKGIWRADADGSNEQLLQVSFPPRSAAYDPVENRLYVGTGVDLYRISPDGSGFQWVIPASQFRSPEYVVVDYRARKLYWTDFGLRVIRRSNLDGSNAEDFVTTSDVGNPNLDLQGLTIVYNSMPIPTMSGWGLMAMSAILLAVGTFVVRKRAKAGH